VISQLSEPETRAWAVEFEQFVGALHELYSVDEVTLPPLTIVLFRSSREFAPYRLRTASGQARISAFFGNTVLRYSVTIGLYMFSMGVGALIATPRILEHPVLSLQRVELALAVLGAISIPIVFLIDAANMSNLLLSLVAHFLIIVIGILTGIEIPLLIEIRSGARNAASRILGIDYVGAFVGTVAFALWFYPKVGIFATAILTASLNAMVGIALPLYLRRFSAISIRMVVAQAIVLSILLSLLLASAPIEELGIELYIKN